MNDQPIPYRASYSGRVRDEFAALVIRARARGLDSRVLAAAREIDRRLQLYPQFGQPLRNLSVEHARLWIGVVSPLVVHYVLDEENRHVMVVLPFQPLPNLGL
jgi:hypothetical protein